MLGRLQMINWGNFGGFFTTGIPSEVLYLSLVLSGILIVYVLLAKKVVHKGTFLLWVLLLEYAFVVICSTIVYRSTSTPSFEFARLELMPFWTYGAVVKHTPGVSVWDIILNIVLFLPLGFLVKLLYPKIRLWKMAVIAVCFSVFIEANQYFFMKGITQIDDVMHNKIGATIGWILAKALFGKYNGNYKHDHTRENI